MSDGSVESPSLHRTPPPPSPSPSLSLSRSQQQTPRGRQPPPPGADPVAFAVVAFVAICFVLVIPPSLSLSRAPPPNSLFPSIARRIYRCVACLPALGASPDPWVDRWG
ncbi:hypothetical protein OsI_12096 [Oryza sativa Indica Group]|uniref:Uncharacterized protein n=1 Tax=Oryza sativa subsp. indica TaxID=39946 RepID=B8AK42_ORYSI|nr:hypothetical protein OsI_12096 [Oryza sativa Indica Group]